MELENGVKLGCLPFSEIDVRNLLQSFRNVNRDYDPIDLIAMCKKLKDENPHFQYDFKLDGHNRLEHFAWSYASSVELYVTFGDAMVFDTTHRMDSNDMLLGIWVGVDNHGLTSFFGCVLLRDENMQSFSWGLKTFLGFLKGKAPPTLTDQNMWLKEAIAIVADIVECNDRAGSKQKMQRKLQKISLKHNHQSNLMQLLFSHLMPLHISCSCHHFEFSGILCRHVLRVLSSNNCFHIPDQYLPSRWRINSSSSPNPLMNAMREHSEKIHLLESMASTLIAESIETEEHLDVACEQTTMVLSHLKDLPRPTHCANNIVYSCPSDLILPEVEDTDGSVQCFTIGTSHESITSGKLKERRPRDGIDITRKRRHFSGSCCGQFGHDSADCPMMGGDNLNGDALGYL
ncbi:hypothetical protein CRYUN_Cryun40dG0010100 [Craigia yunnanensis]